MRRIVASFGGAALLAALLTLPVTAAPAQRVSDTERNLFCGLSGDAGSVFIFASESEQFGSFADLAFWAPLSPPDGEPTWITVMSTIDFDDTSVTASFDLVEFDPSADPEGPPFGDPVGTATLNATLTPSGEPEAYSFREHDGNRTFRRSGVVQFFSVEGTVELPTGISFDLSGCEAVEDAYTQFSNAPASNIFRASQFTVDCFWEVDETFISFNAFADEFGTNVNVFVSSEEAELIGFPSSEPTLTTEAVEASFELFDAFDPEPSGPVGSADASATLTAGERINEHIRFDNTKVHITGTRYLVDGTLSVTTPGGTFQLPMDDESCFAADQRIFEHQSGKAGGGGGKPLANDAPQDAKPIAIGETVTVGTRGADLEPEAPCLDGDFELPIGSTGWWTFEGTGGDVSVDTAGSDFDTMIGVYVDDGGGGLLPIGCVDDVDSLQARITVPTDAGVTYWLQVGGFGGASGNLVLSVS